MKTGGNSHPKVAPMNPLKTCRVNVVGSALLFSCIEGFDVTSFQSVIINKCKTRVCGFMADYVLDYVLAKSSDFLISYG